MSSYEHKAVNPGNAYRSKQIAVQSTHGLFKKLFVVLIDVNEIGKGAQCKISSGSRCP